MTKKKVIHTEVEEEMHLTLFEGLGAFIVVAVISYFIINFLPIPHIFDPNIDYIILCILILVFMLKTVFFPSPHKTVLETTE
jgi:hypothetical protein